MFCDRCGAKVQPGARFCASCGRPLEVVTLGQGESRLSRHLRLLAVLWLALSAFRLVAAGALLFVGRFLFPSTGGWPFAHFLPTLFSYIGGFLVVKAFAGFAAGWGLLERQAWARLLTLVLGFLALFDPPLGTALGIYTLWVLLPAHAGEEYQRMAHAA